MNSFETLNKDEVYYFSYFNYNIEYLEKIFNRNIEYEIGISTHSAIEIMNENIFNLTCYNENKVYGIIFKLKKNELDKLNEIFNQEYDSQYILVKYKIYTYFSKEIISYLFVSSIDIVDNDIKKKVLLNKSLYLDKIHKIFNDCNYICIHKYNIKSFYEIFELNDNILLCYYDSDLKKYKPLIF